MSDYTCIICASPFSNKVKALNEYHSGTLNNYHSFNKIILLGYICDTCKKTISDFLMDMQNQKKKQPESL